MIRALARDRNFALLWVGEVLSDVGSQATTIAMPLLVLSLTGSAAQAGLVGVARTVAYPLAALPSGVIADRLDRRRVMMACAFGRLIAIGSVPVALVVSRPSLVQLMLVRFADAVLWTAASNAERGLLGEIATPEAFPDAIALNEARSAGAVVAGPPLGGALFGIARALPFAADACSFAAVLGALSLVRVTPRPRPATADAVGRGVRRAGADAMEGVRWLWRQPFLRAGSLIYAAANVTVGAVELLGVLIARHHGATSAAIGGAYALVGIGGIAGAGLARPLRRRVPARIGVLAELWGDALLIPLLLAVQAPAGIGVVLGCMFLPMTLSSSIIVGRRLALTPDRLRSRVQAAASLIATTFSWAGPLAVGVLFRFAGESTTVIVVAAWALVLALVASVQPSLRRVPEVPGAQS